MDLETEKEKALYEHKLAIRRLLLEKILFGTLLALVGIVGNVYYEKYRSELAQERFLLEKRSEAVNAIRDAYGQLQGTFMKLTTPETIKNPPPDCEQAYDKKIQELTDAANKWSVMLSPEFNEKINSFVWIHDGFHGRGIVHCAQYRLFAVNLHTLFESCCRVELGLNKKLPDDNFHFKEMSWEEASGLTAKKYLNLQYGIWQKWKDRAKKL